MHRPQVITPTKLNRACPPQRLPYLHPDLRLYNVQWQRRCETLDRVADVGTDAAKEQLAKLQAQQERPLPPPQACLRHQHGCKQLLSHPYPTGQLYDITTGQPRKKQLIIHATRCPSIPSEADIYKYIRLQAVQRAHHTTHSQSPSKPGGRIHPRDLARKSLSPPDRRQKHACAGRSLNGPTARQIPACEKASHQAVQQIRRRLM